METSWIIEVTPNQNMYRFKSVSRSGYRGVRQVPSGKWVASIRRKPSYIGHIWYQRTGSSCLQSNGCDHLTQIWKHRLIHNVTFHPSQIALISSFSQFGMLFHPCLRKLLVVTRFFVAAVASVPPLFLTLCFLPLRFFTGEGICLFEKPNISPVPLSDSTCLA